MSIFQAIVLTPILSVGMAYMIWLAYKGIRTIASKKHITRDEKLNVLLWSGIACLFINFLWFVPQVVNGDMVRTITEVQDTNCRRSTTADGEQLTESQCWYFEDVLNGKYNEQGQALNIREFLSVE